MLQPIQQEIAVALGYQPITGEEASQQYQAEVNYDPELFQLDNEDTHPVTGSVWRTKRGKLCCYWKPECSEEELEGWYDVPTNEEIEEYVFDSYCLTPGEDSVEPDHPDSWLSILGLI